MKCIFRKHQFVEIDRYLMFTGEDRVFYKCDKCGKEKEAFTLETYYGKSNAPSFSEWYKAKMNFRSKMRYDENVQTTVHYEKDTY